MATDEGAIATMTNTQPLAGLLAPDLSQGIAGPHCARLLADHGARVLKVEPPQGDWMRGLGAGPGGTSASALAIVAVRGSQYDGLVHRQTALLCAEQDEEDMAAQICWCLENPRPAKTIAATAQAYAREHHSISRMVNDYLRVYRRLTGRLGTLSLSPN